MYVHNNCSLHITKIIVQVSVHLLIYSYTMYNMTITCIQVDHGYDVNWLSELRQVSVLFINLDPDYKEDELEEKEEEEEDEELQSGRDEKLLQTSFEAIYPVLVKYDGKLIKEYILHKNMFCNLTIQD